ncbi:hypothetical protein L6R49_10715 [Myxococcota bacterium]|nr:hypothetical protein [Myxococcota bacterium]
MAKVRRDISVTILKMMLRVHILRLSGRPTSAAVYNDAVTIYKILQADEASYEAALDARVAMTNEINYLDHTVATAVGDVNHAILAVVKRDRQDPRYRRVFPQNPSDIVKRGHAEEQNRFIHSALAAIAAEPDLAAVPTADLHTALTALETARAHRETLYAAENEAKARLRVTFDRACDHLDEAEPRLTLLYPKQPALVKSFFYTKPKGE